jgi:alpha-tubulin suppressor-like RCC1 family protein
MDGVNSLTNILAVEGGNAHACALTTGHQIKCWGEGLAGQLGQGVAASSATPVTVSVDGTNPLQNVVMVSVGSSSHSCALLSNSDPNLNGAVVCWGYGGLSTTVGFIDNYLLGNGSLADQAIPVPVLINNGTTPLRGVIAIDVREANSCAVIDDGSIYCWGGNEFGQLGQDSTTVYKKAVKVLGFGPNSTHGRAVKVEIGRQRVCALLANGTGKCWGENDNGEAAIGTGSVNGGDPKIGDTPNEMANLIAMKMGTSRTIVDLQFGSNHGCAVLNGGDVKCWGYGDHGRHGNGSGNNFGDTPGTVGDGLSVLDFGTGLKVKDLTCGNGHCCVLLSDGQIKCFGRNREGQAGSGSIEFGNGDAPGEMGNALKPVVFGYVAPPLTCNGGATAQETYHNGMLRCQSGAADVSSLGAAGLCPTDRYHQCSLSEYMSGQTVTPSPNTAWISKLNLGAQFSITTDAIPNPMPTPAPTVSWTDINAATNTPVTNTIDNGYRCASGVQGDSANGLAMYCAAEPDVNLLDSVMCCRD